MTPEEEAAMADDLYANGRVLTAHKVSNGHAGGHHGVRMPTAPYYSTGPPTGPRPKSALVLPVATAHQNGHAGQY